MKTDDELPQTSGVVYKWVTGSDSYCVGDDGSIWSRLTRSWKRRRNGNPFSRWRKLKPTIAKNPGYPRVDLVLDGKSVPCYVHVIVLMAFRGPPPVGHEAAHQDGVRSNCCLSNLFWKTHLDNVRDQVIHDTRLCGHRHPMAKLTEEQVQEIKRRIAAGERTAMIAGVLGIARWFVKNIRSGRAWADRD